MEQRLQASPEKVLTLVGPHPPGPDSSGEEAESQWSKGQRGWTGQGLKGHRK